MEEEGYYDQDGENNSNCGDNPNNEVDTNQLDDTKLDHRFNINSENNEGAAIEMDNFDDLVTSTEAPETDSNELE